MVFEPMTIVNIGNAGVEIETPFPLQLDSLHQFRLSLGDLTVVVQGRIAHGHVGELRPEVAVYRSGVEFVELSDHAVRAIRSFVRVYEGAAAPGTILDGEILGDEAP